jgi:hypothetical protein
MARPPTLEKAFLHQQFDAAPRAAFRVLAMPKVTQRVQAPSASQFVNLFR